MEKVSSAKPEPSSEARTGIMKHFGAFKDSKTFEGDPVAIQRAMRDEWTR